MDEQKPIDNSLPRVRTYKGDVSSVLQDQNISAVDIALAEQKKGKDNVYTQEVPKKNIFPIVLSILLIVLGVFAIGYSIYLINSQTKEIEVNNQTFFKYFEYEKNIDLDLSNLTKLRFSLLVKDLMSDDVRLGAITRFNTKKTISEFISAFNMKAPEELLRSVYPDFFFGFYAGVRNYPFIIMESISFERTFAGMLSWEKDLHWDMEGIVYDRVEIDSSSTSTSMYRDIVLNNQDTRMYFDQQSNPLFFYTFLDNKYVLITSDRSVLEQIAERLQKSRSAR